jgi:hypothetical protein
MSKEPWNRPGPVGPLRREEIRRELGQQLKEAREQVVYYRHKRVMATLKQERARFGGLVLAWEMTAKALAAKLDTHNGRAAA